MQLQKNSMKLQLRQQTINALNLEYKSHSFHNPMTLTSIVLTAETAMRGNIDLIDYELNGHQIAHYGIKVRPCQDSPFTTAEQLSIQQLIGLCTALMQCSSDSAPGTVNAHLQSLKIYVAGGGLKIDVSPRYHKYRLYFKCLSLKQAIVFQVLNKCQIFYTIQRQRKRSGKAFALDPLIHAFEHIQHKLEITHPFHETVLPKKQLRFFQKKITDKKMKNLLFDAVSTRNHKEVRQLLAKGASLGQPGIVERQMREMYCQHRACQLADLQMCKILQSYRPSWQVKEKQGLTPLHYAVQAGHLQLVQFLLQQVGVQLQSRDIQNRTPFYFACTEGDLPIIRYLYQLGADINNQSKLGRSALSKSCYLGLVDVVTFLLGCRGIEIKTEDGKGRTALHNAVFGPRGGRQGHKFGTNQKDSPECTQLLLENGFDVDFLDKENNTPLHVAMSSDGRDSIRVLLAYGASLTQRNCYGETPLMTGAKFGHIEAVSMLKEEYNASLAVKDIFLKNLMLLCAKFRQDDGKAINQVFYYATNHLLAHARSLLQQHDEEMQEKVITGDDITDWQIEIDYTFHELLKERKRVEEELNYFCLKCRDYALRIKKLTLDDLKQMLLGIKTGQEKQQKDMIAYFVARSDGVQLSLQEFTELAKWILLQNNTSLLELVIAIQKPILNWAEVNGEGVSLTSVIGQILFMSMGQMKQKMITFCLLKLDIDWLRYLQPQYGYNLIHLLVKFKKVGTLIQILKVLSAANLHFPTNSHLLPLLQQAASSTSHQSLALTIELRRLLLHRDNQGLDPYSLALLVKDAAGAKLLEQKLGGQSAKQYKVQLEVRQYRVKLQQQGEQFQLFNQGYELEKELQLFLAEIQNVQNTAELHKCFSVLREQSAEGSQVDLNNFESVWKHTNQRKLTYIRTMNEIPALTQLGQSSVIGIDIEYFYAQGHTLISIMQISTPSKDYIIDFLDSAHSHQSNCSFTTAVSAALRPVAHDRRVMKVMHGSDNDLCVIKAVLNLSFLNFLDTARLDLQIGKHQNIRGLATLLQEYLHTHMPKDYQVSEWRVRPIPPSMLEYARRDSMALPFLAKKLLSMSTHEKWAVLLGAGCRQARRNRKPNQFLIRSIEAL